MINNNNKSFISGSVSGFSQIIVGHPFDTVKVWLQVNKKQKYNIINLYRGIPFPLLSNSIVNAGVFGIYNYSKKYFNSDVICGFIAGGLISPIINVSDLYKIRNQNKIKTKFKLYKGFNATFLRESIAFSSYFTSYNQSKYLLNNFFPNNKTINQLLSGGIAGITCWLITYPFDTIKTRIQTHNMNFKQAYNKGKLWIGLRFCLYRAFIVNSVGFYTYEYVMNNL
tara:strand:- start:325 stop:999 length:675 start_codon:yes stop_codon:yes gene_type:complete